MLAECGGSAEGTAGAMAIGGRMWVYQLFVQLMCVLCVPDTSVSKF